MKATAAEIEVQVTTVSPSRAAEMLGLSPGTMANWRWSGTGPSYCKVGGRVRYRLRDLSDYLDGATRISTSDVGPHAK